MAQAVSFLCAETCSAHKTLNSDLLKWSSEISFLVAESGQFNVEFPTENRRPPRTGTGMLWVCVVWIDSARLLAWVQLQNAIRNSCYVHVVDSVHQVDLCRDRFTKICWGFIHDSMHTIHTRHMPSAMSWNFHLLFCWICDILCLALFDQPQRNNCVAVLTRFWSFLGNYYDLSLLDQYNRSSCLPIGYIQDIDMWWKDLHRMITSHRI